MDDSKQDPRLKFNDDGSLHKVKITGGPLGSIVEIDGHPVYARRISLEMGEANYSSITLEIPAVSVEIDVHSIVNVEAGDPDNPAWFHCTECGKLMTVRAATCCDCNTKPVAES